MKQVRLAYRPMTATSPLQSALRTLPTPAHRHHRACSERLAPTCLCPSDTKRDGRTAPHSPGTSSPAFIVSQSSSSMRRAHNTQRARLPKLAAQLIYVGQQCFMSLPLRAPVYRAGVRHQPALLLQQATRELEIRLVECAVLQAHLYEGHPMLSGTLRAPAVWAQCAWINVLSKCRRPHGMRRRKRARGKRRAGLCCVAWLQRAACGGKHRILIK